MKICEVNFNEGVSQPFVANAQNIIKNNPETKAKTALTALSIKRNLKYKNAATIAGNK